jgi:ATP-dependent protease HslVU (ClpYQ) peptidase subunit
MTTLVAVQGDGFVVVGCDTRISYTDESGVPYQIMSMGSGTSKVALNGKYLLGAAGDMRAINILHHVFQPPVPPPNTKGKKLDAFIANKFIPALRSCFDSQGYSLPDGKEDKEHIAQHSSSVLVVVNKHIYIIDGDYSWTTDATGLYATGSGSMYALGALSVLIGTKKPQQSQTKTAVLKALQIASKFDPFTGAPFNTFIQT